MNYWNKYFSSNSNQQKNTVIILENPGPGFATHFIHTQ